IARCQEWRNTSDERIKSNIERISNPLSKMRNIKGVTWVLETNGSIGYGFIAQDVEKDFPEAVSETKSSPVTLRDGSILDDVKSVNTPGVAAALHHEAILALMDQIDELKAEIAALKAAK
ncbi:tail fiber domain-containing protein, partial [Escherichia coli]